MRLIDLDDSAHNHMCFNDEHEIWCIDTNKTVDAVPVIHGKWIYSNDFHWYTASCNKCGYQRRTDIKADGWNQWKFCPNCGARMDAERKEKITIEEAQVLKKQQTDDAERKEKITIEEALEAWQKIRNMFKNGDASYVVLLNPRIVDCAIDALENQLKKDAERKEE